MNKKQRNNLIRILLAAAMLIALHFVTLGRPVMLALYLVPYLVVGYDILRKAYKGIVNRQPLDENLLMAIATIGALALAVYRTGDFTEAVAVMLFYQVGELFQSYAVGRSRRNIGELMDIRPDYANIEGPEGIEQVDPDEVEIGTVILVQPGEKIPIDGIIEEGSASIDTSALTGESVPRTVHEGDSVLSGCINTNGLLRIRTTQEFDESTASKILDLVENASSRKSRSENFISRFARIYTPVVVLCAVALAIIPPLLCLAVPGLAELSVMGGGVSGAGVDAGLAGADSGLAGADSGLAGVGAAAAGMAQIWSTWIYRALTFLVVSCPCALVISIPLSFFAGIGGASREGILIKGSNFLEGMSQVKTVVMDKTGTLTKGVFEVTGVYPADGSGYTTEEILHLAAHAERHSSHPIALALRKAYGEEATDGCSVEDVEEIAGHGIRARVDGHVVCVGNMKMMALAAGDGVDAEDLTAGGTAEDLTAGGTAEDLTAGGTAEDLTAGAGTVIHVSVDGNYAGAIVIADVIKENSAAAIERMKAAGVSRTVMLTGDMKSAAEAVGKK
ncbi:MAG: heavy metal translocating P-type ATPase, partial [Firmicutes bacterium]|nr:heavy metal translocating P-type ATPase [Bacillota bacterium]